MWVNAVWIHGIVGTDGLSHAAHPGGQGLMIRQQKAAVLRSMAIGVDRDIRDREGGSDEKRSCRDAAVQCGESAGSSFAFRRHHALMAIEPTRQCPKA